MAATNKVGVTTFTTPSDREFAMTRTFDAPRRLVFDAFTNPKHLPHWLLGPDGWTMPICEVDLRPGGSWRFVWRRANGTEMEIHGTYIEVTPPERFVSTEKWAGSWPETINTLTFVEEDSTTMVTTTMLFPSKSARDAALATGATDGASRSYDRLDEYLRYGA
jgi:uncharacterized protein YndB with AHSA1/START domain